MTPYELQDVRDPRELRALTHPVRLRLLEELMITGPATATQLAERVGESPANCSWHLRQLARYGYVAEAGGGAGRQRPWRAVVRAGRWGVNDEASQLAAAGDEATQLLLEREMGALRRWLAARPAEQPQWRAAGFVSQSIAWLTADELTELQEEIHKAVLRRMERRDDPAVRPPGSRPVRLVAWAVPAGPADAPAATPHPSHPSGLSDG